MKKKWMIFGLSCALLLSACSKDKEEPVEPVSTETEKEKKKEVLGLTEKQWSQLKVTENPSVKDGVLSLSVEVQNTSNENVSLFFAEDFQFELTVLNAKGEEIEVHTVVTGDRINLNKKETLLFEYEYEAGKEYGDYQMVYTIPLLDEKGEVIEAFSKQKVEYTYERPVTYHYMPNVPKTLVYTNNNGSGMDNTEEFMYFDKGYAQAFNTSVGGNIIYYNDDNGYYRVYSEVSERKINILNDIEPNKELLLPLPVKEGQTWQVDGIDHKVVEDSITINTAYGSLSGVTIVETNIGVKVRFYYHKDFGMVRTEMANAEGNFETVAELREVR